MKCYHCKEDKADVAITQPVSQATIKRMSMFTKGFYTLNVHSKCVEGFFKTSVGQQIHVLQRYSIQEKK